MDAGEEMADAMDTLASVIYDYESDTFNPASGAQAKHIAARLVFRLAESIRCNEPIRFACDGVMLTEAGQPDEEEADAEADAETGSPALD